MSLRGNIEAARIGCAKCGAEIKVPPSGDPFQNGPWRGRYICPECWTLWWAEHPEELADETSRRYVLQEAKRILALRSAVDTLFDENGTSVHVTGKGTFIIRIRCADGANPEEYDPERLRSLIKAIRAITEKIPGYVEVPVSVETK